MGLLTQRKEHRVPDLSRYDYYYQRKDDYNKSPRLSAAAAYAASRARGNPVLVQQRSQSFTQPRRVVRTRPRTKSRGAAEDRDAAEFFRTNSIVTNSKAQDTKGRSKSMTRRTIRRINGVDYMETVTTTPLEDEDNARHFSEFSEPMDGHEDEYPARRVRRVRRTVQSSPKSVRSARTQRGPASPASPPRSPITYQQADAYQYGEQVPAESEYGPPPAVPASVSPSASVRRTASTSRPVRSKSTKSVRKPVSGLQSSAVATTLDDRRLTEQEMYARALEIAQRNVYSGSDFSPEILDGASSQDGQGISRMGQRSLRRDNGRSKKKFTLFNKDRDAGAGGGLLAAEAPRASGASSLDNRLGQNIDASASSASKKNLSDEEMYGQALAMSQSKAQRTYGEPESRARQSNFGAAEREMRSPHSNANASFVTPAQTIDENYEDNFQDAENYDGEWKDARSKVGAQGAYDYPDENDDRYDFEEPEAQPEYKSAGVNQPQLEAEEVEPGLEQEYVDPERLPKASTDYEPEYQAEEPYEPAYERGEQETEPFRGSGGGYSGRSGVAENIDEDLVPPRKSAGSGLASPIDTTKSGFSNRIASPEEVRAGDLQASGVHNVGSSGRSPRQQTVQSPLEDSAARGGFDSEADVNGPGGGSAAAVGGVAAAGASRRKSKGFGSGLSRFKTRKSLFGGKPDEQPLPDLPQMNLPQAEHGETEAGYVQTQGPQYYEDTARESRPKNKIKSMFNKVVEFGAENSGYQPPREVKEQQKVEKFGAGALREGDSGVSYANQGKGTALGGGVDTDGPASGGAALGNRTASGAATGGVAQDVPAGTSLGGIGNKGGGSHPWRRNAQPVSTADGGAASGRTPYATTTPQQPSNDFGVAAPAGEEGVSSGHGVEQSADEGYADGFADGLRDSQYQSGYDRAEKANGAGGDVAASGVGSGAAAADVNPEDVSDGVEENFVDRYGVQEKLNQAKESSWGQKAIGKAEDTAQSQAKEQKGNLFKKLFKK